MKNLKMIIELMLIQTSLLANTDTVSLFTWWNDAAELEVSFIWSYVWVQLMALQIVKIQNTKGCLHSGSNQIPQN